MTVEKNLTKERAKIYNVSPQFVRTEMQQGEVAAGTTIQMLEIGTDSISEKLPADYREKNAKKELERIRGEDDPMTRNEKKKVIEQMAEKFTRIDDLEEKTMIVMIMSAYAEGKAAGRAEERRKWEEKKNKICN